MKSDKHPIPIKTQRLILRNFVADDFPGYAAYRSRPDVYRYLYALPSEGQELETKFLKSLKTEFDQNGDAYRLAIVRQLDQVLVGDVMLKLADKAALQAEIGYVFNPDYSGQGYATEAVRATINLGFNHFKFHRIFARLDTCNSASVGVMDRLGLRREAHFIENDRFNGVWSDEYIYALLATEWEQKRGR